MFKLSEMYVETSLITKSMNIPISTMVPSNITS